MNDTERENPMSVSFDFAEGRSHVKIIDSNNDAREYRIPMAIRYIDDYDVWRHDIEESNYFIMAYNMLGDNSPSSLIWDDLIYGSDFNLKQYPRSDPCPCPILTTNFCPNPFNTPTTTHPTFLGLSFFTKPNLFLQQLQLL
jgi:hypothetical protein